VDPHVQKLLEEAAEQSLIGLFDAARETEERIERYIQALPGDSRAEEAGLAAQRRLRLTALEQAVALREARRAARGEAPAAGGKAAKPAPVAAKPAPVARGTVDEEAYAAVLADLDALIGLEDVKRQVHRLAELLRMAKRRRGAGLRTVQPSLHLVFEGSPGSGKTTVARLFGRLYHALGLLATDRVTEVTRADLVSGYVGQTAGRTDQVVDQALDGILFIDEAYALVRDSEGDFGGEAVAELLKRMEDDRGRLAVIAAGYPVEMEAFLDSNTGFRSRFGETIRFDDYSPAELLAILESFCTAHDYELEPAARDAAAAHLEDSYAKRDRYFANARLVRNLFEDIVAGHAERVGGRGGEPSRDELVTLTAADVVAATPG
jgi:SpoVK/Ycf46/Vps4 family AAA+-type ATPase